MQVRTVALFVFAIVFLACSSVFAQSTPTKTVFQSEIGSYEIDYQSGVVKAIGFGTAKVSKRNSAALQGEAAHMARTNARTMFWTALSKVVVDKDFLMENAMGQEFKVRSIVKKLSGATNFKGEQVQKEGKVFKASVVLECPMNGDLVKAALLFKRLRPEHVAPFSKMPHKSLVEAGQAYTGVVIDARGTGLKPSLIPEILVAGGEVVFGHTFVKEKAAEKRGIAVFTTGDWTAFKHRVGEKPLVIKAEAALGDNKNLVQVSTEGAFAILSAQPSAMDLLRDCKLVILL